MLADVAERFLQHAKQRDPLRGGQLVERAVALERGREAGAPAQRRQFPLDRFGERLLEQRARLERMSEVAQVLVQLRELRLEVGEAADDRVSMLASDERHDLLAQ